MGVCVCMCRRCAPIPAQFKGRNPASGFQVYAPALLGGASSLPLRARPSSTGSSGVGAEPWLEGDGAGENAGAKRSAVLGGPRCAAQLVLALPGSMG